MTTNVAAIEGVGVSAAKQNTGTMNFFADGYGSLCDTDITIIVAAWCGLVLLVSFFVAVWTLKWRQRARRTALVAPCVFLTGVWMLTPWLQFAIARMVRMANTGAYSYGFVRWDVPNWLAPVVALATYAITIAAGMHHFRPTDSRDGTPTAHDP